MRILNGLLGISVIFIIAYFMSSDRKSINWRTISIGFLLQLFFTFLVLMSPFGKKVLGKLSSGVTKIIDYANEGINFLFGSVIPKDGGMIFAFQVLTIIIFISSLVAVLYYLGIMQMVVRIIGGGLAKLLGTSQVETLSAAANIFLSQTEAPLLIRPYILRLSTSELFTVMVGGLASVSGSVLVGYNLMGVPLEYLIAASFMAAPAGLIISKIIMPEKEKLKSDESVTFDKDQSVNVIDAAARGASDGLQLALNIGAMLLAFISLIALINGIIGWVGNLFGNSNWSMENLLGYVFYPLALVIGVPLKDALTAGSLIGQKLILNEFVAFSRFGPIMTSLDPKTVAIITFALCGFANISSIAILIGGLGGMEPKRKDEIGRASCRERV